MRVEKQKNILLFKNCGMCILLLAFLTACTPKNTTEDQLSPSILTEGRKNQQNVENQTSKIIDRSLREAIYFANSLEKEALKLVSKSYALQHQNTLFSTLSYAVEVNSGAKKSPPTGLSCSRLLIEKNSEGYSVKKNCSKPAAEVVRIKTITENSDYEIYFSIKELQDTVGLSVVLTGSDVICNLHISEKKLQKMNCQNWAYQMDQEQAAAIFFRAKDFIFDRNSDRQFMIKGSYFKELVENKKIDVMVPIEGKIKVFEKEIEVIDEFLDKKGEVKDGKENKKDQKEDGVEKENQDNKASSEENAQEVQNSQSSEEKNAEKSSEESIENSGRGGRRGR